MGSLSGDKHFLQLPFTNCLLLCMKFSLHVHQQSNFIPSRQVLFFYLTSWQPAERKWLSSAFMCVNKKMRRGWGQWECSVSFNPLQWQLLSPCQQLPGYWKTWRHSVTVLSPSILRSVHQTVPISHAQHFLWQTHWTEALSSYRTRARSCYIN